KILSHPTSMRIPIYNSLSFNKKILKISETFEFKKMNNFNFQKIDKKDVDLNKSFNPNNFKTDREKYVIVNQLDIFEGIYRKN
ncbi:MAG: hypothetical protein VXY89_05790, partial [SAR324 cluster bacterium]|nr:hypothetical protein [SAR324 cluster bacterium]